MGWIKCQHDFATYQVYYIFIVLTEILFSIHIVASVKQISNDLMHAVHLQCMFALFLCVYYSLYGITSS